MTENRKEAKVYIVAYVCDACGKAEVKQTGRSYPVYPPQYEHICPACNTTFVTDRLYPATVLEATP